MGKISPPFMLALGEQMPQNDKKMKNWGAQNVKNLISPESKLSHYIESPPALTETSIDKGIKDFSTKYLHQGMWPSKQSHD